MDNALIVFNALRTFDRPATLAEIERESGLDRDQVHEALRTLDRHQVLVKDVQGPRRRGLYKLVDGARPVATARGRYERDVAHRQRIAALVRAQRAGAAVPGYSPAMPPSHAAAPGALRTVGASARVLPVGLDLCALARVWKKP